MDPTQRDILTRSGAVFDAEQTRVLHFGEAAAELAALRDHCALRDRSDLARLLARGPDLLSLLSRLSTAKLDGLVPGTGTPTVVTTSKGRIVERLWVHRLRDDAVLLVGGAGRAEPVLAHLARYTFAEDTGLEDVSDSTRQLALVGPRAGSVLKSVGLPVPEANGSAHARLGDAEIDLLGEDGDSSSGYSIVLAASALGAVWAELERAVAAEGGRPAGELAGEAWRILSGLPAPGSELDQDYNPLEAGLYDAVSFDKGCYVGQEVVARLNTYDKVSRRLVGLAFPPGQRPPSSPEGLFLEDREVGRLTSATMPPGRDAAIGLGYVKHKQVEPGRELTVGAPGSECRVSVVPLPFPD